MRIYFMKKNAQFYDSGLLNVFVYEIECVEKDEMENRLFFFLLKRFYCLN